MNHTKSSQCKIGTVNLMEWMNHTKSSQCKIGTVNGIN